MRIDSGEFIQFLYFFLYCRSMYYKILVGTHILYLFQFIAYLIYKGVNNSVAVTKT